MQYGLSNIEMRRLQTDLSHRTAQQATWILPVQALLLVNVFWKLFPFRSKHIQLAERKQKAFGKAAGNEWGGVCIR